MLVVSVLAVLLGSGLVAKGAAQRGPDPGDERPAGAATNLFASVDVAPAADALKATLPRDWTLRDVVVLRYGSTRVAVETRREQETVWIVPDRPLRGPYEVIVQVNTGTRRGVQRWSLVPVAREGSDWHPQPSQRVARRIRVESSPPPTDADNYALAFEDASHPVDVRADLMSVMNPSASFTAELWMRTTGLDEVVLSTWSGDEQDAYPLELVVDASGRLQSYCGRPGRHDALTAPNPVANGRWHHVAVVYAAPRQTLRLLVNGAVVDSLANVRLPTPRRSSSALTLGGRPSSPRAPDQKGQALFTGAVDEVRLWATARSAPTLRAAMRRPSVAGEGLRAQIEFDEEAPEGRARAASGTVRTPSTLALRTAVRNLQATANGSTVRLQWSTEGQSVESFVVERSTDGITFTPLATVDASPDTGSRADGSPDQFVFADEDVSGTVVFYRIRQVYTDGGARTSGVLKMGLGPTAAPDSTVDLLGNFPNPFTETTTIAYEVNERVPVTLSVWNLTGHRVADLVDATQAPGRYELQFDASDLPSGTYFVRLQTPHERHSHRMVVLK